MRMACALSLLLFATVDCRAAEGVDALRLLLAQPEAQIDLARAKATIDHAVDPSVDIEATVRAVDAWADAVRARLPAHASTRVKVDTLLSTLMQPGPWNDHRPFAYDYSDPFAKDLRLTFLSRYLETRTGQCVAMPTLVAAIGQRLRIDMALTTAPQHMLVKYGDPDAGQWINIEATSGRVYPDSAYESAMRLPSVAIEQGTYLRPHTPRESVALLATATLARHYKTQREAGPLLALTASILDASPKDVVAMTLRADAHYLVAEQLVGSRLPFMRALPPDVTAEVARLTRINEEWYMKAEASGWKRWSEDDVARYRALFDARKAEREGTP